MELIHPKCVGDGCGTWELCINANSLKYGCIYYDDEAMDMEIDMELSQEIEGD